MITLTPSQFNSTTGHRSATVAQQYISHSSLQKRKASEALTVSSSIPAGKSLNPTQPATLTEKVNEALHQQPTGQPQPTGQQQVVINLSGTFNIGGSMSVHSSGVEEVRQGVEKSSNA